tara:strand:- start:8768 stop:9709 length:942 start_codon:yes stop_codon:yes gene_type:complete
LARHFLLIDPLEKLVIKKDSSILLALTLQERGHEVYFFFEKDFAFNNRDTTSVSVTKFSGRIDQVTSYISDFKLEDSIECELGASDILHMRLDPPFDARYLRVLWMLIAWQKQCGVQVVNDPRGIALHNEKLVAYERERSLHSFVGASESGFARYLEQLKKLGFDQLILKPLDLFQGYGVEKVSMSEAPQTFVRKVKECGGALVAQPFDASVLKGEIRSIYYKGKELGTILKVPPEGKYLANIAQGATFAKHDLSPALKNECQQICGELAQDGVDWIAFDILGENISEVNITCPGLLVEVSKAMGENLAKYIS